MFLTAICNRDCFARKNQRNRRGYFTKLMRIMQLTAVCLLVFGLSLSASSISQTITFRGQDVSLEKIITVVKQQTGYLIVATKPQLRKAGKITISANAMPLDEFLTRALDDQPLSFAIDAKTIFLKLKTATPSLKDSTQYSAGAVPPITVKGKIINEKGEPVTASIIIKGTKFGTTTNADGFFVLNNVDDQAVLTISGINIETQEVKCNGKTNITVHVISKINAEEEVVVNKGYYTEKQQLSTGNVFKVNAKDIEKQPVTSLLMALQGRVPGLQVTPFTGTAGSAPIIRIRGNNSLRNSELDQNGNRPLYIIDGVPVNSAPITSVSSSFMYLGFDPLSLINPADIESIEVLKDGDATAIFGSRGANGVIIITTKKSKTGGATTIDFSVYKGIGQIQKKLSMLNLRQYLDMRYEGYKNDNISISSPTANSFDLTLWDTTRSTDWQETLLGGTASITDIHGSLTGGNGNNSFQIGGGYHKETTIFPDDFWTMRKTFHASFNHASADKKLAIQFSSDYGSSENKLFDDASYMSAVLFLSPNAPPLYDASGHLNWAILPDGRNSWNNPLSSLIRLNKSDASNFLLSGNAKYALFPFLKLGVNLGFSETHGNERVVLPLSSFHPSMLDPSVKPSTSFGSNYRRTWNVEPQVSFTKHYGNHAVDATSGLTIQKNNLLFQQITAQYASDDFLESLQSASTINIYRDEPSEYKYSSFFTRIGYNYRQKLMLNLTGRRDGSSRFGIDNKFGNFGSLGAAWIFTEEPFIQRFLSALNFGKLRASYGITGNDQLGDYQYYDLYIVDRAYNDIPNLLPRSLANPAFKWESTKKLEVALQSSFFNNRISVDVSYYRNISDNQLVNYQLPATAGFPSLLKNFEAVVQNTGWEFFLNIIPVVSKKIRWTTSINLTLPRNKLLQFPGIENSPYAQTYQVGSALSIQRLYSWIGVDPSTGKNIFKDFNSNGIYDDGDRQFARPLDAKIFGGINNTIRWKNFDVSVLLQFSDHYLMRYLESMPGLNTNQPIEVLGRWQKTGDVTSVNAYHVDASYYKNFSLRRESDDVIAKATYLRLKTFSIAYSIPKKRLDVAKVKTLSVFMQGQNIFTISPLKNLDPETGTRLPPLRMITFGIQAKF